MTDGSRHDFEDVGVDAVPLDPAEIDRQLRIIPQRLEHGVEVINVRNRRRKDAKRLMEYEKEVVFQEFRSKGMSVRDAESHTKTALAPALAELDEAEADYDHAVRFHKSLQDRLSALQTMSAGQRASFQGYGRVS